MTKIINTEKHEGGYSFLMDFGTQKLWLDAIKNTDDDDYSIDWNKYIFFTKNEKDMEIKKFQEDTANYETALNTIYSELETLDPILTK